jgi:hypothetical protein
MFLIFATPIVFGLIGAAICAYVAWKSGQPIGMAAAKGGLFGVAAGALAIGAVLTGAPAYFAVAGELGGATVEEIAGNFVAGQALLAEGGGALKAAMNVQEGNPPFEGTGVAAMRSAPLVLGAVVVGKSIAAGETAIGHFVDRLAATPSVETEPSPGPGLVGGLRSGTRSETR